MGAAGGGGDICHPFQQQFCDVNAQDVDGNTPVHCAAVAEYIEILSLLVNKSKYNPDVLNQSLHTVDDLSPLRKLLLDLDSYCISDSNRTQHDTIYIHVLSTDGRQSQG